MYIVSSGLERGGISAFRAPEAWVRGQKNTVAADTGARKAVASRSRCLGINTGYQSHETHECLGIVLMKPTSV